MSEKEIRLLLIEDSVGDARLVCEMLAAAEHDNFRIYCAENLLGALEALAHATFDIAVVDLTLPDSQGLATFETVHRHAPNLPVVILTGLASEQLALASMERGAQEYLVKGRINTQALVRVLHYAIARAQTQALGTAVESASATCETIGFLGAKGGVGCTTAAANFAVELARQSGEKTLLMDLDVTASSCAFLLRAESQYTIADAAQNLHRLDSDYWTAVATPAFGLDLVLSSGAVDGAEDPPAERVRHVLRFAQGLYRRVVVDMGRLTTYSASLVGELDQAFLVCTPGLPEVFEAGRTLRRLITAGVKAEAAQVVFNRATRASQPAMNALEQALGRPTYFAFQDCGRELDEAYANGRFLDERGQMRRQAARMATKFLGSSPSSTEAKKPSGLLSMLGLKS